jgi:hypothetical protein
MSAFQQILEFRQNRAGDSDCFGIRVGNRTRDESNERVSLENVQAEIRKTHGPVTQTRDVSAEAFLSIAGGFSNATEDSFGGGEGGHLRFAVFTIGDEREKRNIATTPRRCPGSRSARLRGEASY